MAETDQEEGYSIDLTDRTEQEIRDMGMTDLLSIAEKVNIINDPNLTDVEDMRQRIILIRRKQAGTSHKWQSLFSSVASNCRDKTKPLESIMREVRSAFGSIPTDPLSQILTKEKFLSEDNPDILYELDRRTDALTTNDYLVVVAGETNGGKSSLLNLMLGMDVLPTDVIHCTFAICKMQYSDSFSFETLSFTGEKKTYRCQSAQETSELLTPLVARSEQKARISGPTIKEITLRLPSDILKSGVTLVDTPGIGEDDKMDDITMNYVKNTHASGFLYIIKTDSAGGVQEDRLMDFLRAVRSKYTTGSMKESFDPKAAMFVCHRWDTISDEAKEKVKASAINNLEFCWPGFDPSQLFFFSTMDTLKHLSVDKDLVTDSFSVLLRGIQKLFDRAVNGSIRSQYLWVRNMVHPASEHLRSMITFCIKTNEELEKHFRGVATKQEQLLANSREKAEILKRDMDERLEVLKSQIGEFLNLEITSVEHYLPEFNDLKQLCSEPHFFVKRENRRMLDDKILINLLRYVDGLVMSENLLSEVETHVLEAIQSHLGLYKNQIRGIKRALTRGEGIRADSMKDFGVSVDSTTSNRSSNSGQDIDEMDTMMHFDPARLASDVKLFLEKKKTSGAAVGSPRYDKQSVRQPLFSVFKDKLLHKNADPLTFLKKRSKKIADRIRQDDAIMTSIVFGYSDWIRKYVERAVESIPMFIAVNMNLMDQIREHRLLFQRDKELLKEVMDKLEPFRNHLKGYGSLYMSDVNAESLAFTIDRRTSSVTLPDSIGVTRNPHNDSGFRGSGSSKKRVKTVGESFWARLQLANLSVDDQPLPVVVKTYTHEMGDRTVLSEIAALRCLDHETIAPFFGMTRLKIANVVPGDEQDNDDAEVPRVSAFLFKGFLVSARLYNRDNIDSIQEWTPRMITSLLQGLYFIHREGMVHMELNLDTVMVDKYNGNVKLCHICKPRAAVLPENRHNVPTHQCVCLSPPVLDGHSYESTDDIYAFGLLLWEILFPQSPLPFHEERQWPLETFIEKCHPSAMLADDLDALPASTEVQTVLRGTLLVSRGSSAMSISAIQRLMDGYFYPLRNAPTSNEDDDSDGNLEEKMARLVSRRSLS